MGRGGKVIYRRGGGGGGWRGRGARVGRVGGSDGDASDEEYVVGEDEEGEGESSYDSYSSDASREASEDAGDTSCSEEEEEEEEEEGGEEEEDDGEYDLEEEEDAEAARRRPPQKRQAGGRKPAAKPLRRRKTTVTDELEEVESPPVRKPRARQRPTPKISAEEEEDECEDDGDEDFAPDEDEDEDEEPVRAYGRKAGGGRTRPGKRRQRRRIPKNPKVKERRGNAPARKRRRTTVPISDDDDFVVKDRVSVDGAERKKMRASSGRKRRSWASSSDPSDSNSFDSDYAVSDAELVDLQRGGPMVHRARVPQLGGVQVEEKGKGKEIDDSGKQVCGICLSEEHHHVVRGLLDCCGHYFCFPCIMEWSKVESRCPVCKRRFKTVSKSARSDAGFFLRTAIIRIPKRDQVYQPSEEEIRGYLDPYANAVCMECRQGGDDNLMLLCDICDSSAHTYCVGLGREVPDGNWYCNGCRSTDPSSLNSWLQEYAVGHETRNSGLLQEFSGRVDINNVTMCTSNGIPQQSSALPFQPHPEEISQDTSIRRQSSGLDSGISSRATGFAASTVSGRRSIHQRIRIILSNNRVRLVGGAARNDAIQHSSLETGRCISVTERNVETCYASQENLTNGTNERSYRSLGPRVSMHTCMHNEGSSCHVVEGEKKQIKSIVKNHLVHWTRDISLDRSVFKEIARHATHSILAACGFQHRRSMVTTMVQVPSNCVHLADGELASVVKGCCSSCFSSFVGNVVQEILHSKLQSA